MEALAAELRAVPGVIARPDEPAARHLPLRCGGPVDLWVVAPDPEALGAVLAAARRHRVKWRVHWPFEDWLVRDGGIAGMVVRPGRGFEGLERLDDGGLRLGAAPPWGALAALGEGWWSELARWPGCPGGMLAGPERRWLRGLLRQLRWRRGRRVETVRPPDGEVPEPPATAVLLDVDLGPSLRAAPSRHRRGPPPPGTAFADPEGVRDPAEAWLARAGLLGSRLRAWVLSEAEPGVLVNRGGGRTADALMLLRGAAERVERTRGVTLTLALPVVGRREAPRRPAPPPAAPGSSEQTGGSDAQPS